MEEYNDKLHDIIKSRLAERDRKSQSIKRWSRNKGNTNLRPIIGFAVAACLVGVLFIMPWSNTSDEVGGVRSAFGNIDELIKMEKYDDALFLVEKEIATSDSTLMLMTNDTCVIDEETEYNISAIRLKISDLKEKRELILKKIRK